MVAALSDLMYKMFPCETTVEPLDACQTLEIRKNENVNVMKFILPQA